MKKALHEQELIEKKTALKNKMKKIRRYNLRVIGRTHDPSIMEMVVKPKKKIPMITPWIYWIPLEKYRSSKKGLPMR